MANKAVFFDRDGTLNVDVHYLHRPEDFIWIDGAKEAIKYVKDQGYLAILVTNQSGVARGFYPEGDVVAVYNWMNQELAKIGTELDALYYCPHHPKVGIGKYKIQCHCRKPETGMFEKACDDFGVDIANSWMIGDNVGDIKAGNNFHLRTILVRTGYGSKLEKEGFNLYQYIADDLYDAVSNFVCKDLRG